MTDKQEPSAIVLPFGKHKGSTVAEIANARAELSR